MYVGRGPGKTLEVARKWGKWQQSPDDSVNGDRAIIDLIDGADIELNYC